MKKKIALTIALSTVLASSFVDSCSRQPKLPTYDDKQFTIAGWWSPYEQTAESYTLYKEAGLNTLLMTNHSFEERTTDTLDYLGSNHTQKSLELCREVGLKAILNYGDWYYSMGEGQNYGETPFSTFNYYGEYKDIIVGMHVVDEPSVSQMKKYGNDSLTADYKSVYSVPYMVNLFPDYANYNSLGTSTYEDYLKAYGEEILSDFPNNAIVSVDYYPYQRNSAGLAPSWLMCYEEIAKLSKKYRAKTHFYLQSATKNEFVNTLTEEDIRLQAYVALCFGADWLSYYCYSMPHTVIGEVAMYDECLLNMDNEPTKLYYYAKEVNAEIQSFASAFLSYDWVKTVGFTDEKDGEFAIELLKEKRDFSDRKNVKNVSANGDAIVGCFENEDGEGYMLVNYSLPSQKKEVEISVTLKKKRGFVAVYGGENYSGEPQIIQAENGVVNIKLKAGEGKFITPLK